MLLYMLFTCISSKTTVPRFFHLKDWNSTQDLIHKDNPCDLSRLNCVTSLEHSQASEYFWWIMKEFQIFPLTFVQDRHNIPCSFHAKTIHFYSRKDSESLLTLG